jgi:hypothetical protein
MPHAVCRDRPGPRAEADPALLRQGRQERVHPPLLPPNHTYAWPETASPYP